MKITYLHQYFATNNMPGGTRSYEFAKRLVEKGHQVNMITTWRTPDDRKDWFETNETGIKVYWLPISYSNNMSYVARIKAFLLYAWHSARKAASLETDIVFATSTPLTIALPAVYLSKKKRVPLVFEVRDLWPTIPIALNILKNPVIRFIANFLESWAYKNSNSIVALSPAMKEGIILKKKISRNKIAVIPNNCDISSFSYNKVTAENFRKKRTWLGKKPLFVYAGTFGTINNLSYAVQLAVALKKQNSNIRILLIGDGKEYQKLTSEAKKYNVFEVNLFFEKQIPKKEIIACFLAADMCANFIIDIKETWANSANKFFDCLAAGKPIFLNHGGWMQDLVSTYDCGLCMHGKSFDVVARELELKMSDFKWLQKAGKSSKNLARKFFDCDVLAQQLENVLVQTKNGNSENVEKIAKGLYK